MAAPFSPSRITFKSRLRTRLSSRRSYAAERESVKRDLQRLRGQGTRGKPGSVPFFLGKCDLEFSNANITLTSVTPFSSKVDF